MQTAKGAAIEDGQTALLASEETGATVQGAAEVRWLAFLFVETTVLLAFQVFAGLLAGSLALLADSGHSCTDVISYGINYFVERQKVAATSQAREPWGQDRAVASALVARVDLIGCVVSMVLLCGTNWLALNEAWGRLFGSQAAAVDTAGDEGDFESLGPVLLLFAIVSTAANLGTLIIYRRWQVGAVPPPSSPPPLTSFEVPPLPSAGGFMELGDFEDGLLVCSPCNQAVPAVASSGRISMRCAAAGCGLATCGNVEPCGTGLDEGTGTWNWSSTLHMIVHPGCDGSHASCEGQCDARSDANLNVTSAMLHLVADVLRGVTILGAALVIELRLVSDARKVDAICALLVAIFVTLGSAALLQRVWTALSAELRSCWGGASGSTDVAGSA